MSLRTPPVRTSRVAWLAVGSLPVPTAMRSKLPAMDSASRCPVTLRVPVAAPMEMRAPRRSGGSRRSGEAEVVAPQLASDDQRTPATCRGPDPTVISPKLQATRSPPTSTRALRDGVVLERGRDVEVSRHLVVGPQC